MRYLRCVLVLVKQDDKVLMVHHKTGFNRNKWTPIGGRLRAGEPLQNGVARFLKEDCGISADEIDKSGKIEIKFAGSQDVLHVHIFSVNKFAGEVNTRNNDLTAQWFSPNEIPFKESWADVAYWMRSALEGKKVRGFFVYQNEDLVYDEIKLNSSSSQ